MLTPAQRVELPEEVLDHLSKVKSPQRQLVAPTAIRAAKVVQGRLPPTALIALLVSSCQHKEHATFVLSDSENSEGKDNPEAKQKVEMNVPFSAALTAEPVLEQRTTIASVVELATSTTVILNAWLALRQKESPQIQRQPFRPAQMSAQLPATTPARLVADPPQTTAQVVLLVTGGVAKETASSANVKLAPNPEEKMQTHSPSHRSKAHPMSVPLTVICAKPGVLLAQAILRSAHCVSIPST